MAQAPLTASGEHGHLRSPDPHRLRTPLRERPVQGSRPRAGSGRDASRTAPPKAARSVLDLGWGTRPHTRCPSTTSTRDTR